MPIPKRKYIKRGTLIHGVTTKNHPLYPTYNYMLVRCYCEDEVGYKNYGGRGIKVYAEWLYSFKSFAEYVVKHMGFKPSGRYSFDRIDNDKNYEPGNVRWASRSEQCVNRRVFENNSTGFKGVVPRGNNRFLAKFSWENKEYNLGNYGTAEEAGKRYTNFKELFFQDREKALRTIQPTTWVTSSTGLRGVNKCGKGFTSNCTIDKKPYYIGYFKTKEEAYESRQRFLDERIEKVTG